MRRDLNAVELTLYVLVGLSSAPSALGFAPLPPSLADGNAIVARWTLIAMLTGCALAVIGMLLRDRADGVITQQVGLAGLFFAGIIYAAGLMASTEHWWTPLLAAGLSSGLGLGTGLRFLQLRNRVNERIAEAHQDDSDGD